LSYRIIGCAFDVYNELGAGHLERYYQNALKVAFKKEGLRFDEQVYYPLLYKNELVGKGYLDFCIEDKIIVEIKKGNKFSKKHIDQVLEYLKTGKLELGILINFGSSSVAFRRIVNIEK